MIWHNAQKDAPPANNQVVLVSVDGVYYITVYDVDRDVYVLRDDKKQYFDPAEQPFYWIPVTDAPLTRDDY
jgi:hypothetical protein